ncbi:TorD/DmsD family molecular chaperone [Shewanella sp. GXUN23E]|uniref:TorD/DmsD family molecular chaperone n=1 Tax=Shewanella sp. GXUN23E TaxID=3422498 RepID=UPI003D7CC5A1
MMTNEEIDFELLQGMARVLNHVFYIYPEKQQLDGFAQGQLARNWPLASAACELLQQTLSDWLLAKDPEREQLLLALKLDYGQLFFGPGHPKAAPWGSVYTSETQLLNERSTLALMDFYREQGITVSAASNEPVDHIGLIFAVIDSLLLQAVQGGDEQRALMLLQTLLSEHLLPWSGQCLALVELHATTDYYRCFAVLAKEYLVTLSQVLGPRPAAARIPVRAAVAITP